MFRNKAHAIFALVVFGLIVPTAMGQTKDLSQLLAPCVSEQTLAIVQINVTRIDADALCDWVIETAPGTMNTQQVEEVTKRWRPIWKQRLARFQAAGGESLYIIWSLGDTILAVPTTNRLNESVMKNWLDDTWKAIFSGPTTHVRKEGLLIAGPREMMDRWQTRPPLARSELAQATAQVTGATVEVLLIPSADSRRVLEAMLPAMLGQGIDVKSNAITQGLQWATIGINLPPKPSLNLYVESTDAASASAIREFVAASLSVVGRIPALKQASPNLEAALAMLTPKAEGRTLKLALSEKQCNRLATNLLTPGLFELRESFLTRLCATVLNGMGKAMLIYANDHEDKWPPNLETLVDTVEYPRCDLTCPAMRHRPDYESYVYRGADTGGCWVEPSMILVHDRAGNHEGGRNVLFVDTHVEWVTETRFQELVERDNEMRRGRGLPEKFTR